MKITVKNHHLNSFRRITSVFVVVVFLFSSIPGPLTSSQADSQTVLNLPVPGTMLSVTESFHAPLVEGLTIYPEEPYRFDFIIDPGENHLQGEGLEKETTKLIKQFLAALTVPEEELWVNLSPYERNRIIPDALGKTEMGRDLLAQDYLLKQLTSSLMYPEDELGKKFWDRVYQKSRELYGTTDIPMNTFNRVWIIPERAVVYQDGQTVFVAESHLKVMMEEDYINLTHNSIDVTSTENVMDEVSKEIIREIIIPEIEREVNEGKTFAELRQIYHSVILATWFKRNLRKSLLGQVYVDQNKINGIDIADKAVKEKIYQQYVEAFEKGAYNFIREEYDEATQEVIPQHYFSGGAALALGTTLAERESSVNDRRNSLSVVAQVSLTPQERDSAQLDDFVSQFLQPNSADVESIKAIEVWDGVTSLTEIINKPEDYRQVVVLLGEPDDTGTVKNLGRPGDNDPDKAVAEIFRHLKDAPQYNNIRVIYLGNIDLEEGNPELHPEIRPGDKLLEQLSGGIKYYDNIEENYERVKNLISTLLIINPTIKFAMIGGDNGYSYPNSYPLEGRKGLVALDNHLDAKTLKPGLNNDRLPGSHSGNYLTNMFERGNPNSILDPESVYVLGVDARTGYYHSRRPWLVKKKGVPGENIVTVEEVQREINKGSWEEYLRAIMKTAENETDHFIAMLDIDTADIREFPGRSAKANLDGPLVWQDKGISAEGIETFAYTAGREGATVLDIMEFADIYDEDGQTAQLIARSLDFFLAGIEERIQAGDAAQMAFEDQEAAAQIQFLMTEHLSRLEQLVDTADVSGALTFEVLLGRDVALEKPIHELARPHQGQIQSAANIRSLIAESELVLNNSLKGQIGQDAYSLRAIPQVHGATRDVISYLKDVLEEMEKASVGDEGAMNFVLIGNSLRVAISELADISERRINRMINPVLSKGLPVYLMDDDPGLNSGFMVFQYTAAALVEQLRTTAHPVSSLNKQSEFLVIEHITKAIDLVEQVLAIELMVAAQAADLRTRDGKSLGKGSQQAHQLVRSDVEHLGEDRVLFEDLQKIKGRIEQGEFSQILRDLTPEKEIDDKESPFLVKKRVSKNRVALNGINVTIDDVWNIAIENREVALQKETIKRVSKANTEREKILSGDEVVYGFNTGFGSAHDILISQEKLVHLQENLIRSHAASVGKHLEEDVVRAIMAVNLNKLSRGYSGVRVRVLRVLQKMLNQNIIPLVPEIGSVGSSGDLSPLSHVALTMIGEGYAFYKGELMESAQALDLAGIKPIQLQANEGLSINNGTGLMTAFAVLNMIRLKEIHQSLIENKVSGYTPEIQKTIVSYLEYAQAIISTEINSATDNPLIIDGEVFSGANFHGQPIAVTLDGLRFVALSLADVMTDHLWGHPEVKSLFEYVRTFSHPATVGNIPTSNDQEDHNSMGATAGILLHDVMEKLEELAVITETTVLSESSDASMTSDKEVGGIDLNPKNLNLIQQGNDFSFDFPIIPSPIHPSRINGFTPVIINISPITHFPMLLGETEIREEEKLSFLP